MPTLNSALILQWKLDAGPPKSVQFVSATPYTAFVPDGVTVTDPQIIIDFILKQDAGKQPGLFDLARQGLLTLVHTTSTNLVLPPVPPPAPPPAKGSAKG